MNNFFIFGLCLFSAVAGWLACDYNHMLKANAQLKQTVQIAETKPVETVQAERRIVDNKAKSETLQRKAVENVKSTNLADCVVPDHAASLLILQAERTVANEN